MNELSFNYNEFLYASLFLTYQYNHYYQYHVDSSIQVNELLFVLEIEMVVYF